MVRLISKQASRVGVRGMGERGAVYVEFLIVFMPLFFLFLTVCQFALLAAARLVVQHAALSGARSAIVILEDDPNHFGGAARGSLSKGNTTTTPSIEQVLASLSGLPTWAASSVQAQGPQQGPRMAPIREAVEFPLLALAPREDTVSRPQDGSVASSLGASAAGQIMFALGYTRAAAVITVHLSGSDELAPDPVDPNAAISVHVTYLYTCGVPLVRALICRSLDSLLGTPQSRSSFWSLFGGGSRTPLGKRFELAEDPGGLERIAGRGTFFAPLSGEATLPNQGAAYEDAGKS